jgi:putative ABC transport system permease protein
MFLVFLRLIFDSIKMAFSSLINNKLRTFLSLLGITIGIFCIISVMTVIDSLERAIRDNVSTLGNNTVYVQKWPWTFSSEYPWWKYINRPIPNLKEYEALKSRSEFAGAVAFVASTMTSAEYNSNSADNVALMMASHEYDEIRSFNIEKGRYFTQSESNLGQSVIIIGAGIAERLFGSQNPVGKEIKAGGNRLTVVGVFKREGEDMFNNSMDEAMLITINYARTKYDLSNESLNPFITVSAKDGVSTEQLIDELTILMRTLRRLKPMEEEDFALNQASMISKGLDSIFSIIDLAGIIIGGFAILVGGFGIANIMFVSVKERTKQIGIQKAIGAKSYLILLQFLTEAVALCMIGGIVGLVIIWLGTKLASGVLPLDFALSMNNVISGVIISLSIGIVSGFAPARQAAKLQPVVAMSQV